MGKVDTLAKAYVGDSDVFADIFNFYLFGGEQVLDPSSLTGIDPTEITIPYEDENCPGEFDIVQKGRDLLKSASIMTDGVASYLILGVENQADISYIMPVRSGTYDFLQYGKQIHEVARRHRQRQDYKGHNEGEFLSGFFKEDGLYPVFTIVVYWGSDAWTAPTSLWEMMSKKVPVSLVEKLDNYHIRLIQPAKLTDEDFGKFKTDFGVVMNFIKLSKDKKKMAECFNAQKEKREVRNTGMQLINACTKSRLKYDEKAEVIDVCEAIQGIMDDSKAQGILEGRVEGRAEGRVEGRVEGRAEYQVITVKNMIERGYPDDEISAVTGVPVKRVEQLRGGITV